MSLDSIDCVSHMLNLLSFLIHKLSVDSVHIINFTFCFFMKGAQLSGETNSVEKILEVSTFPPVTPIFMLSITN